MRLRTAGDARVMSPVRAALFVSLQNAIAGPARGMTTITLEHVTFTAANHRGGSLAPDADGCDLEEVQWIWRAPWKVFFVITCLDRSGTAAGWLLAFTLSLDDLVISSSLRGRREHSAVVIYSR